LKTTSPSSNSKDSDFPAKPLAREQYLYLSTRGRKSGRPREIEIWFTHRDGRFYVIAEYPTSHWVQNLLAHPEVQVRVAGKHFSGRARILPVDTEPDLNRAVRDLSREKYGWGDGLVVELTPNP
jgi:deazaflavin-dependent oxidoreductase (nitroreductase family)